MNAQVVTSKTRLAHLNSLLAKDAAKLNLPAFRASVGSSGSNQDWLRKAMKKHPECSAEIKDLLDVPFKDLLKPHVE